MRRLKALLRNLPVTPALIRFKGLFTKPASQNDETFILHRLLTLYDVPKRFIEFGFSGWEFNCASLVDEWDGLLVDGDPYNVSIARNILPKTIRSEQRWLTLEALDIFRKFAADGPIGVLSIDVDGNDYWFLEALIDIKPAIIIAEYNSSFGRRAVTVPYKADFTRKHEGPVWPWYDTEISLYFGASLAALDGLARRNGYSLVDVTQNGVNAFFLRNDLLDDEDRALDADQAFRDQHFPDGSRPEARWKTLENLPFVHVA